MIETIKAIIEIHKQHALTRKALRLLNDQMWSVEFLTAMLSKAAKVYGSGLEMIIVSKDGKQIIMRSAEKKDDKYDDDIFNHLDNEALVNQFINDVQRHR